MKLSSVAATAALLVAGSMGAAVAQTAAPVTLISSQAQPQIADGSAYNQSGSATVSFVNTTPVPATEVDFTLSSNGETLDTFSDVGTFAPNVKIDRTFANDHTARDQQLSIREVKFADGTVWINDEPLPAGQRAVNPWLAKPDF